MKTPKKVKQPPPWHPNFRLPEALPDIKVVRTGFLINSVAVALAGLVLVSFLYREIAIMGVASDIASLRKQQADMAPGDKRLVEEARAFAKEKPIHDDLERFFDAPLLVHELFRDLALIRPPDIAFERMAYNESTVVENKKLRRRHEIHVLGQTRELEEIQTFKNRIRALPYLADYPLLLEEGANPRNVELDSFGFDLKILFERSEPS